MLNLDLQSNFRSSKVTGLQRKSTCVILLGLLDTTWDYHCFAKNTLPDHNFSELFFNYRYRLEGQNNYMSCSYLFKAGKITVRDLLGVRFEWVSKRQEVKLS